QLPELPAARRHRFVDQYGLSPYDAELLAVSRATADYYEETVRRFDRPKIVANWMTGELFRLLNVSGISIERSKVSPPALADLLRLIDDGTVSIRAAKDVFERMFQTGESANQVVESLGLRQISDAAALERLVDQAIAGNPKS